LVHKNHCAEEIEVSDFAAWKAAKPCGIGHFVADLRPDMRIQRATLDRTSQCPTSRAVSATVIFRLSDERFIHEKVVLKCVVAGLCEAGIADSAGVTDPSYSFETASSSLAAVIPGLRIVGVRPFWGCQGGFSPKAQQSVNCFSKYLNLPNRSIRC